MNCLFKRHCHHSSHHLSNPNLHYASLLQTLTKTPSPSSFALGLPLHSQILKLGLDSDRFVGNSLLSFYFKLSPDISLTHRLFTSLHVKDVISWTTLISGYVRHKKPFNALQLFVEMTESGFHPNGFTLSSAINACKDLQELRLGKCFHGMVLVRGFDRNFVIASSMIDMYGRNGALDEARRVFDEMCEPTDVVCWTTMISVCTKNDRFDEAIGLFHAMVRSKVGVSIDEFTFGSVLMALGNLGKERSRQGKEAHAKVVTRGFEGNVVVGSSILDMYAKCGLVDDARKVFDRMKIKNVVSWCALLSGYCQNGDYEAVLCLFQEMDKASDRDYYSFGTALRACAGLAAVRLGKELHCRYLRTRGWRNVVVESALVDLYAKCGHIDYAHRVFLQISERNMITWNAMICGLAQNGRAEQAIEVFDEMIGQGLTPNYISFIGVLFACSHTGRVDKGRKYLTPNYISFIGVLFACSHTGRVDKGRKYFRSMRDDYEIRPGIEHYNCMVDLFSRVGLLEEAEELIQKSESYTDDSSLWSALLGACVTHSSLGVAERVAKKMMELDPVYHLSYVMLTNVYRMVGRWDDALKVRKLMRSRGLKKKLGKSWIDSDRGISSSSASSDSLSLNFEEEAPSPLILK